MPSRIERDEDLELKEKHHKFDNFEHGKVEYEIQYHNRQSSCPLFLPSLT